MFVHPILISHMVKMNIYTVEDNSANESRVINVNHMIINMLKEIKNEKLFEEN